MRCINVFENIVIMRNPVIKKRKRCDYKRFINLYKSYIRQQNIITYLFNEVSNKGNVYHKTRTIEITHTHPTTHIHIHTHTHMIMIIIKFSFRLNIPNYI